MVGVRLQPTENRVTRTIRRVLSRPNSPYAQATLDERYAASLAQIPDGKAKTRGIAFGTHAAEQLIKLRAHDGRNAPIEFTRPPAPGVWRPTTPATTMVHPWMGFVTPLLVRRATQFAPPDPPALTSARHTRDFDEVKAVGSATSTVRTADQTDTARLYSGNAVAQFNAAMSSTPGCGWGSTSASRTRPPVTWGCGSPTGLSATTSSQSASRGVGRHRSRNPDPTVRVRLAPSAALTSLTLPPRTEASSRA